MTTSAPTSTPTPTPSINRDARFSALGHAVAIGRRIGNPANESMLWSAA